MSDLARVSPPAGLSDGPGGQRLSPLDLKGRAGRVAHQLGALGVKRGDRLAVVSRGGLDSALVVLGALAASVVIVPVNPGYLHDELRHVLVDAGVSLVVDATDDIDAGGRLAVIAAALGLPVVPVASLCRLPAAGVDAFVAGALDDEGLDDPIAMLIYTSGTTGRSKGCTHTRRSLRTGLAPLMELWSVGADDAVINALPLFHVHGLCVGLLGPLWSGASVMLLPRFSPAAVLESVLAGGTTLMCVPTMVHRLIAHLDEHPGDAAVLGRLRLVTCGSAPLSATHLEAFRAHTGLTILERYGMSETLITLSNPLDGVRVPGAVGRPVPGTVMRVVDDELQVQTPGMMRGYWGRPDADAEVFVDGDSDDPSRWFRTGDAVSVDDDGVVRIVGRLSQDILKVGGFKLSAREIEDEILRHPAVLEATVVGLPDEEWGEQVCAAVVLRPGMILSLEDLQVLVQLSSAKKPRALLVLDALPRNAMGKVLKSAVKALARPG